MTTPGWPVYDGKANATDDLVQPWLIPGWTAQNIAADTEIAGTSGFLGPGWPSNLVFTNITGTYFDGNSSGIPGFLTVMMSDNITVVDGSTTLRMPQRLVGFMNQGLPLSYNNFGNGILYLISGRLSIGVFCTDQTSDSSTITTDNGGPLTYWVTEHFLGGRQYQISVPSSGSPGPADINSLIVSGSVTPYAYDPVSPMGSNLIPVPKPSTVPACQPAAVYSPGVTFTQSSASETWTINTSLGYNPGGITVIDGSGTIWMPETITYPSANQVVLTFATAVAGTAYLS